MPQVDFYVTAAPEAAERLRLACRITEKAFLAGHRVLVWDTDAEELARFDDLLWTFADRSFVPHERAPGAAGDADAAPVLLANDPAQVPQGAPPPDVVVNLDAALPPFAREAARIVEVVNGEPGVREQSRVRYRAYREAGANPATHQIADPASL